MFSKLAVAAAVATPIVAAQLAGLPTCAETPAIAALGGTGCALTNAQCICDDTSFLSSLQPAVAAACSPSDLTSALQFAYTFCAEAGVTLTISSPPASTTAASAPATTTTTPAATTPAVTSTTPAVTTPAITSTLATVVTTLAPVSEFTDGQPQKPTNATTVALPTVTPFKGAADSNKAQGAVMGLLAALGIFVAL